MLEHRRRGGNELRFRGRGRGRDGKGDEGGESGAGDGHAPFLRTPGAPSAGRESCPVSVSGGTGRWSARSASGKPLAERADYILASSRIAAAARSQSARDTSRWVHVFFFKQKTAYEM